MPAHANGDLYKNYAGPLLYVQHRVYLLLDNSLCLLHLFVLPVVIPLCNCTLDVIQI